MNTRTPALDPQTPAEAASGPIAPSAPIDRAALREEIRNRRRQLATTMRAHDLDAIMVASEANAFYLTGYETTFFGNRSKPLIVVLTAEGDATVVCHIGEEPSVRLDAIDADVHPYVGPQTLPVTGGVQIDYQLSAVEAAGELLAQRGIRSVGIEESWHFIPGLTPLAVARLRELVDQPLRDASPTLWLARRVKSPWEREQMRHAADVCARAHRAFVETARVGMSERELNRMLRWHAYREGAEKIGYTGIIAGVDRAPLGGPTDRVWERGQMLFVDLCLQLGGGYFADFNRMYASDAPTDEQQSAYAQVVDALDRGREITRAGVLVKEIADAMIGGQDTIYARVGHGLGLEMPEPPSLSPQDDSPLRAGEVICLEPNRRVPGIGWLVSEETVAVTDDGVDLLSPSFPRELEVMG
jgi:Xaa-Pro aminopeptidase